MADRGDVTVPPLPRRFGGGAFRGSVVPNAAGPRPAEDPVGFMKPKIGGADPIQVGARFGAPSAQRRGIVAFLREYASGIPSGMIREIFVSPRDAHNRVVRRRMAATPAVRGLTPSRDNIYRAPIYVGAPDASVAAQADGPPPASRFMGGR